MSASPSNITTAIDRRYSDAYLVARTIDGFGSTIKIVGIGIGVILALASLAGVDRGGLGVMVAFIGIAFASAVATVLFLLGTLAAAQGQILKATLDTAVNSSRFLSDEDRARIMSLPHSLSPAAGAVHEAPAAPHAEWRCRCGQRNPAATPACLECGIRYGSA